jgi:hypothetical protein
MQRIQLNADVDLGKIYAERQDGFARRLHLNDASGVLIGKSHYTLLQDQRSLSVPVVLLVRRKHFFRRGARSEYPSGNPDQHSALQEQ